MPEYLVNLKDYIEKEKLSVSRILVTHWHPDHVGGVPAVLKTLNPVPTTATSELELELHKCSVSKFRDSKHDSETFEFEYLEDGAEIRVEGATLK